MHAERAAIGVADLEVVRLERVAVEIVETFVRGSKYLHRESPGLLTFRAADYESKYWH